MAVIDLKNEKRINVNGEWDKVTTHPNNEPIFRQNGHELVLDSANQDYLGFSQTYNIQNEGDYIEIDVFLTKVTAQVETILSEGDSGIRLGKLTDGTLFIDGALNTLIVVDGLNKIRIEILGGNKVVTLNGLSETQGTSAFRFSQIAKRGSIYTSLQLYTLNVNNETFNPTDIDSNGQIEGSSGTVATVNTSHASGVSYILGTVFQKSSFALGFDSGNNEFSRSPIPYLITKINQISFDVTIQKTALGGIPFSFGQVTEGLVVLLETGAGFEYVEVYDSTGTKVFGANWGGGSIFTTINEDVRYTFDGATFTRISATDGIKTIDASSVSNNDTNINTNRTYTFARSSYLASGYKNMRLKNATVLGTNYPLTEGLGNTTNDATIYTSHADGIKRINFGMWEKGNDTDGWTPYTIV